MVSRDGGICSVLFLWRLTVRLVCLMDGSCDAVDWRLEYNSTDYFCVGSRVSVVLRLIADVT